MQQAEMVQRENWRSRFGFIMAAAGSAIGLGNIWRFPYLTGMNGGGAFIVIYLMCVIFVGLSIMIAEFAVGRKTGLAAVGAYKAHNRSWSCRSLGPQWIFIMKYTRWLADGLYSG